MFNRILHLWLFHMKFMKQGFGKFHIFLMKRYECKVLCICSDEQLNTILIISFEHTLFFSNVIALCKVSIGHVIRKHILWHTLTFKVWDSSI